MNARSSEATSARRSPLCPLRHLVAVLAGLTLCSAPSIASADDDFSRPGFYVGLSGVYQQNVFENKVDFVIHVEHDQRLFNQYGVMLVNPAKHSHVKAADGQAFVSWLLSDAGQRAIAAYRVDGQQLFFPNAGR